MKLALLFRQLSIASFCMITPVGDLGSGSGYMSCLKQGGEDTKFIVLYLGIRSHEGQFLQPVVRNLS